MPYESEQVIIPFSERWWYDWIYILSFGLMFFIALFVDSVSGLGPFGHSITGAGVDSVYAQLAWWPPKPFIDTVLWWCDEYDPAFCFNPPWMKIMALVSVLFYLPFYPFAIYAFIRGRNWIRVPGLMYGTAMSYTLVVILVEEYLGDYAARNFPIVFIANLYYLLFPLMLLVRLRHTHPFSRRLAHKKPE